MRLGEHWAHHIVPCICAPLQAVAAYMLWSRLVETGRGQNKHLLAIANTFVNQDLQPRRGWTLCLCVHVVLRWGMLVFAVFEALQIPGPCAGDAAACHKESPWRGTLVPGHNGSVGVVH